MNLTVTVLNAKEIKSLSVEKGTTLLDILKMKESRETEKNRFPVITAKVDYKLHELSYEVEADCNIEFLDISDVDGMRIYRRSLYFIYIKALKDIFPDRKTILSHAISKGLYCEIKGGPLCSEDVKKVENRMRELVGAKLPFVKRIIEIEEAEEFFRREGKNDVYYSIKYREKPYVTVYDFDGITDYFYGYMALDSSYINIFSLMKYEDGILVRFPDKKQPDKLPEFVEEKKLFNIFLEYKRWGRILNVGNISHMNRIVESGDLPEFIRIAEALQEKKIAYIADMIKERNDEKKIILISGPSSSGKTTFSHRLSIQLRVNGITPQNIALDDYFLDRADIKVDEHGKQDFESLDALDVKLFQENLNDMLEGREVEIPVFSFPKGKREEKGRKLKLSENSVLVIEGIHGLNNELTKDIDAKYKFKIYLSALTAINIDNHNRVPSGDSRLIRRIVRDKQYRATDALRTLQMWPSVRRGENMYIFPYHEEADVMFNTSLIYELAVLKPYAIPLLSEVRPDCEGFSEANRLIEFLNYVLPADHKDVPKNSIIREFVGGSCFYDL